MKDTPEYLTVEEAAALLRIGRTSAYGLAREWLDTGGRKGLPVVKLGRQLRVPRAALEELHEHMTTGASEVETPRRMTTADEGAGSRQRRRRWGS